MSHSPPREYYNPEVAAAAAGVPTGTGKFWYLFRCCCDCAPSGATAFSSNAPPHATAAIAADLEASTLQQPEQHQHQPPGGVRLHAPRRAAKVCLLIVTILIAIAQWSLLASGIDFYQYEVGLSEAAANAMTSATLTVCFVCSIVGGLGGDARIGSVKVLLVAIGMATLSSAALAVLAYSYNRQLRDSDTAAASLEPSSAAKVGVSIAAMLFAASTGVCQTAIPNLIGDQHYDAHPQRLQFFYILFYASLQAGALFSRLFFPFLHVEKGWFVAIASLLTLPCGVALLLFTLNTATFSYKLPGAQFTLHKSVIIILKRLCSRTTRDELGIYYGTRIVRDTFRALSALRVHSPLPIFWALYFQMFGLWFIQTKNTDRMAFGTKINAEHASVLNPLFDVILLFFFSGLFRFLRSALGIHVRAQFKIGLGYCCAVLAFLSATLLEHTIESRQRDNEPAVTMWLQLPQFFFICAAEVLVYPASLHIAYVNSPLSMRSFVQSILWFFIGVGNAVNIVVISSAGGSFSGTTEEQQHRSYVWLYAGYTFCMVLALLLFGWLCWRYDDLNYWELEDVAVNSKEAHDENNFNTNSALLSSTNQHHYQNQYQYQQHQHFLQQQQLQHAHYGGTSTAAAEGVGGAANNNNNNTAVSVAASAGPHGEYLERALLQQQQQQQGEHIYDGSAAAHTNYDGAGGSSIQTPLKEPLGQAAMSALTATPTRHQGPNRAAGAAASNATTYHHGNQTPRQQSQPRFLGGESVDRSAGSVYSPGGGLGMAGSAHSSPLGDRLGATGSSGGGSASPHQQMQQHRRPVTPRDGVQYYSTRRKSPRNSTMNVNTAAAAAAGSAAAADSPQPKQQQLFE